MRIPVWRYGPCKNSVQEGWKLCFAVFSVFFFSAQGCTHTHHRPRIGGKPTSNMILGGYGQQGPTNRPKMQDGLPPGQRQRAAPLGTGLRRRNPLIFGDFDVGMAGKKIFHGGGSKKCESFFSHFWVLFDVDFSMKEKKTGGAHTSLEIWALQKFGPRGLEILFCRFLRFFFSAQGCTHTHHRPRIGGKPTSNMILGG